MLGVTWGRLPIVPCSMRENAHTPVAKMIGKLTMAESAE